jgi:hypothetical protein
MARPYTKLPPGAREHLERMAERGMLGESTAAQALGMPVAELRRVIVEDARSKAIWENCLAIERDRLLESLYDKAVGGDTRAAQTLLAVRHGLSEKAPQGATGGVSITFQLPQAMDATEYLKALRVTPELPDATSA